ncbi:hypothetical protein BH09SUM1_BH09SUM1_32820 [soil metagenome]
MPFEDDPEEEFEWEEDSEEESADIADAAEGEELQQLIDETEELSETGELRKAVRMWRKSMDRFSDDPVAYFHLGRACFRLLTEEMVHEDLWQANADSVGLLEEALSALEEAVSMDPAHKDAWNLIGALHSLRDNHAQAAEAWEKSLKIDPKQKQVREDLASARENLE